MLNGRSTKVEATKKGKAIEQIFDKLIILVEISHQNLNLSEEMRIKMVGGGSDSQEEKDAPEPTSHLEIISLRLKKIHGFLLDTRRNLEDVDKEI